MNSFEAKGCLKSCSIIWNLFFSDSQLANKQYLLFFSCCWLTHTGIHWRVLLCFRAVLWKHCSYSLKACMEGSWTSSWCGSNWPPWGLCHEMDLYIYCIINNNKKQIQQKINILTKLMHWMQFWVDEFTGWKWKFILFINLFAAFIQASKLDWVGACRELFKYKNKASNVKCIKFSNRFELNGSLLKWYRYNKAS